MMDQRIGWFDSDEAMSGSVESDKMSSPLGSPPYSRYFMALMKFHAMVSCAFNESIF